MASILPFDELNKFVVQLKEMFPDGRLSDGNKPIVYEEDILDEMLDLFLLAYATGNTVTNENLSFDWQPTLDDVDRVVNKEIGGKTWRDRVLEYFDQDGTVYDLIRIAETETHRDANESALETAKKAGAKNKTWLTMLDDKVRETHEYLEGMTVGIDEDFYTYDGDYAPAPGMFGLAENNVNCRCELVFS